MTQPAVKARNPVAAHPVTSAVITVLVVADIWFALYVPLFARATPKVGDFPFFYFYLLIYMPATGIVMWIVYLLQKRLRPAGTQEAAPAAGEAR
ncbi:MAG TPA: DUF3311 domain-containing protein [Streptosporangiaceae bacterium]|jgi:hypothetical protein|nr:DUF3311 domain-containing protein [Streptosporangiaceae bacterium]